MKLEIIEVNVSDVKTAKQNAKIHNQKQVDQIKKSIIDFGYNDPITIDEDSIIIEGHGRFQAAKELGWQKIPAVIIYGLTEEQKRAYPLIHNKLTLSTGFNSEVLQRELDSISDFNMADYSFNTEADSYFDDQIEISTQKKVVVTTEGDDALKLREFLNENKYKYKEKLC